MSSSFHAPDGELRAIKGEAELEAQERRRRRFFTPSGAISTAYRSFWAHKPEEDLIFRDIHSASSEAVSVTQSQPSLGVFPPLSKVFESVEAVQHAPSSTAIDDKGLKGKRNRLKLSRLSTKPIQFGDFIFLACRFNPTEVMVASPCDGLLTFDLFQKQLYCTFLRHEQEISNCIDHTIQLCKPSPDGIGVVEVSGVQVHYGDSFFLKYVGAGLSSFFLFADVDNRADINASCSKLRLSNKVDANALFTFVPKSNSRKGDGVFYNNELLISCLKRDLFMQAECLANRMGIYEYAESPNGVRTELNLTADDVSGSVIWKAVYLCSSAERSEKYFKVADTIRIYQQELGAYLSSLPSQSESEKLSSAVFAFTRSGNSDFVIDCEPNMMFRIEKISKLMNGPIDYNDVVRFKHVSSSGYLAVGRESPSGGLLALLSFPLHSDYVSESYVNKFLATCFVIESISDESGSIPILLSDLRIKHAGSAIDVPSLLSYLADTGDVFGNESLSQLEVLRRSCQSPVIETRLFLAFSDESVAYSPLICAGSNNGTDGNCDDSPSISTGDTSLICRPAFFTAEVLDIDVFKLVLVDPVDVAYCTVGFLMDNYFEKFEMTILDNAYRCGQTEFSINRNAFALTECVLQAMISFTSEIKEIDGITSQSLETTHDRFVGLQRQQLLLAASGVIDRIFRLFLFPIISGLGWDAALSHERFSVIHKLLCAVIISSCRGSTAVQDYIAGRRYDKKGTSANDPANSKRSLSYISIIRFFCHIDVNIGTEIITALTSGNQRLTSVFFSEALVNEIVTKFIPNTKGRPEVFRLMSSGVQVGNAADVEVQNRFRRMLFSAADDHIGSRRSFLIETSSIVSSSDPYGSSSICISWCGDDDSTIKETCIFNSVTTLGLDSFVVSDDTVAITNDLIDYDKRFKKENPSSSARKWIDFSSIAWYIDPSHCFSVAPKGNLELDCLL
jgi:hypothetical protein